MNSNAIRQYLNALDDQHTASKKIAIFADFDECATEQHLSRMVTEAVLKGKSTPAIEMAKKDNTTRGLHILGNVYIGLPLLKFTQVIDSVVDIATPRKNFVKFLNFVASEKAVVLYFVSSGLSMVISRFLNKVHKETCSFVYTVATSMNTNEQGTISSHGALFGVAEKGQVVSYLRKKHKYACCVTLGHSSGDYELVKAGDRGMRLCFDDSPQLHKVADRMIEDWDWGQVEALVKSKLRTVTGLSEALG
ncbi:MAG: hypothetical protein QY312_03505 [Candidatus Dojkabacteria bacterium]|nr:MAG: hypothetical protein QY312_03505 [Candidatus Dojkabacteria bacterium]